MWSIEDAKSLGYVLMNHSNGSRSRHINTWFVWCEKNCHPFVNVVVGTTGNAVIAMDLISYHRRLTQTQIDRMSDDIAVICPDVIAKERRNLGRAGGCYPIGSCIARLTVPVENADAIARLFIAYAQSGELQ